MAYLAIDDFRLGIDRRRERVSGIPGSLWVGKNVVISRGGDVVRSKKFVPVYDLPAGTVGMETVRERVTVFGSGVEPTGIPAEVTYSRLQPPGSGALVRIVDAGVFDGKLYTIGEFDDGNVYHFYDGVRVTDWDTLSSAAAEVSALSDYVAAQIASDSSVSVSAGENDIVVTANTEGVPFTLSATATNGAGTDDQTAVVATLQASAAAVAEVRAVATISIDDGFEQPSVNVIEEVRVNGVALTDQQIDWVGSNAQTANLVHLAINADTKTHGYSASISNETVTIYAPLGAGTSANGFSIEVEIPGASAVRVVSTDFAGGVDKVDPIAQVSSITFGGALEADDTYTVTLNGVEHKATPRAAVTGTSVFVRLGRIYTTAGSLVRFCAINDPTDWTTTTTSADAGFINVSADSDGAQRLLKIEEYNGLSAIFAEDRVFIYSLNADNDLDSLVSVLPNTGTRAAGSVVAFSTSDVFYLDSSGVRSVRVRDSSGAARTDDVGTAVDPFLQDFIEEAGPRALEQAQAVIEPTDDLYMLLISGRIWTYTQFPSVGITAWTFIEPEFNPTDIRRTPRRLYVRAGDQIYLYGGRTGRVYPGAGEDTPEIELPFMAANDEAGVKMITGFDIASKGVWKIDLLLDPNDETIVRELGRVTKITYPEPHAAFNGRTTHLALKMTCESAGEASVSSLALHFDKEEKR